MYNLYGDIMNLHDILSFMDSNYLKIYIISPLTVLHFVNCFLAHRHSKKIIKEKSDKNNSRSKLSTGYFAFLLILVIGFLLQIPFIKHILIVTSSFFLIYYLIISPLFNKKLNIKFQEMNQTISLALITCLTYILIQKKSPYFELITNQVLSQILVIFIVFLIGFLIIYILLINLRIITYYLSVDYINNLNSKLYRTITYIDKNYNLDNKNRKVDSGKSKISVLLGETKSFVLFVVFEFIVNTILRSIYFFNGLIINKFHSINNRTLFTISKIAFISTMFSLYLLIQISNIFDPTVISSYEFIASTIVIPLLLESLLKKQ